MVVKRSGLVDAVRCMDEEQVIRGHVDWWGSAGTGAEYVERSHEL